MRNVPAARNGSSPGSSRTEPLTASISSEARNGSVWSRLNVAEHRRLDEALLSLDPAEVGGGVRAPIAVAELLVVAAPGVRERLDPVEDRLQPGCWSSPEFLSRVTYSKHSVGATDRVDQLLESEEVDVDDVVDRNPEFLP